MLDRHCVQCCGHIAHGYLLSCQKGSHLMITLLAPTYFIRFDRDNKYTPEQAFAAAEQGALWMDRHCPGWVLEIDTRTLNLGLGDSCILGQTAHCVTHGAVDSGHSMSYDDTIEWIHNHIQNVYTTDVDFKYSHGF